MPNNLVLTRIQRQLETREKKKVSIEAAFSAVQKVSVSPPLTIDELRTLLITELDDAPPKIEEPCESFDTIRFENLYDFSQWYSEHQDEFNTGQKQALDTLLQARNSIGSGCACRRNSREALALSYFNTFWERNNKTDLLPTIAKITKAKKVIIAGLCEFIAE